MVDSTTTTQILQHISDHISKYYPDIDASCAAVRLIDEQHRPFSSIYKIALADQRSQHILYAKVFPEKPVSQPAVQARARLVPAVTDHREKLRLECNALSAIGSHFANLNDPRLGAIRILDALSEPQAVVMEESTDKSLRALFAKTNRVSQALGMAPDLRGAFFNAGVWLKAFSTIPVAADVKPRNAHRGDFIESILSFADFLARTTGKAAYFRRVQDVTISAANSFLPDKLPLGWGHGDFALRNILVGADDRITVIDPCAKWTVPIYEDMAYLLVHLETSKIQLLTRGLVTNAKTIGDFKKEFLVGYFGQTEIPKIAVDLFQVQLLLDSWSARAALYGSQGKGIRRISKNSNMALLGWGYRALMDRLLGDLDIESLRSRDRQTPNPGNLPP